MLHHESWLENCASAGQAVGFKILFCDAHDLKAVLPRASDDILVSGRKVKGSACYIMYYAIVRKNCADYSAVLSDSNSFFNWILSNPNQIIQYMGEMVAGNANFEVFYNAFLGEFAA
jgi:hypothetical protein